MTSTIKSTHKMAAQRLLAVSTATVLCAALTASCAQWPSGDTVKVGVKGDQPGTGFKEGPYASPEGFDVDVAKMAADALGKKTDLKTIRSQRRQSALYDKSSDGVQIVVATWSINQERMEGKGNDRGVDFIGPYAVTPNALLMIDKSPNSPQQPLNPKELNPKELKICTWLGTNSKQVLNNAGITNVTEKDDAGQCVDLVRSGRFDAAFSDELLLRGFANKYHSLVVVPEDENKKLPSDTQFWGIAIPKGHRKQCQRIKDALEKYVEEGKWNKDFSKSLPRVNLKKFRPKLEEIELRSCHDKLPS